MILRVRIEHGKPQRVEELAHVGNVRNQGVADPPGQGDARFIFMASRLGQDRRHGSRRRQDKQGELFDEQTGGERASTRSGSGNWERGAGSRNGAKATTK